MDEHKFRSWHSPDLGDFPFAIPWPSQVSARTELSFASRGRCLAPCSSLLVALTGLGAPSSLLAVYCPVSNHPPSRFLNAELAEPALPFYLMWYLPVFLLSKLNSICLEFVLSLGHDLVAYLIPAPHSSTPFPPYTFSLRRASSTQHSTSPTPRVAIDSLPGVHHFNPITTPDLLVST